MTAPSRARYTKIQPGRRYRISFTIDSVAGSSPDAARAIRSIFETYRAQTLAKHTIVEKYLFAYFNILKGRNTNLIYVDGFAGRGTYDAEGGKAVPGSPIRALR